MVTSECILLIFIHLVLVGFGSGLAITLLVSGWVKTKICSMIHTLSISIGWTDGLDFVHTFMLPT